MKAVWPRVFGILCLVRPVWGGSHILTPSFSVYPVYPDQPPDYFSFPAFPNGVATYAAGDSVGAALIAPPGWQLSISITYVAATLGSAFCFISRNVCFAVQRTTRTSSPPPLLSSFCTSERHPDSCLGCLWKHEQLWAL